MTQRAAELTEAWSDDTLFAQATFVVIDDVEANVQLLRRLLQQAGAAAVHTFTDPAEAVQRMTALDPDLVLLDLHMPAMDGFAVLETLRASRPAGRFVPVLVLTADTSWEVRRRALSLGAHDFLTKPVEADEALLRARNLLESRALHEAMRAHNRVLAAELADARAAAALDAERRARLHHRIQSLLATGGPTMVFQPIVDLRGGGLVGLEALARFPGSGRAASPGVWFTDAADAGCAVDLEMAAIQNALAALPSVPEGAFLSVNASAETATSDALRRLLDSTDCTRLVLEITEHSPVEDHATLAAALSGPRAAGLRLALDDTGAGYAGLNQLLRLSPDIVKLDGMLTRDLDTDPARRALALALSAFCAEVGATMIAEGIETAAELAVLRELTPCWGQGFLLGRPGPLPPPS